MADTHFVNGTPIVPDWLNDVNDLVYGGPASSLTVDDLTVNVSGLFSGTLAAYGGFTAGNAAGDPFTINSSAVSTPNGLSFTGGSYGFGTVPAIQGILSVAGANQTIAMGRGQLFAYSTDAQAANLGGSIVMGGSYTGTTATSFASISGRKENSTDSNISGYLSLNVNLNGTGMTERMRLTSDGRIYGTALHNNAGSVTGATNQYIASGTYTPTGTAVANCSAVTPGKAVWQRVGNIVSVSGSYTVSFTATTVVTTLGLSLPIASNLAASGDLSGVGAGTGPLSGANLTDTIMVVTADTTNDRANFSIPSAQATGAHSYSYNYQYEVL